MDIRPIANIAHTAAALADKGPGVAGPAATSKKPAAAPAQAVTEVQQPEPAPSTEQLSQALKSINHVLQLRAPDLEFSIDSESHRTIVKVVDKNTQEVIRQMPSQEAMEIAKALDQLQSLLVRQKA